MKILCVAEKPSIAKSISQVLSAGNDFDSRPGQDKYCRNFCFQYKLPPNHGLGSGIAPRGGFVDLVITSVKGHLLSKDFTERYRTWNSCRPCELFTAPIETFVEKDNRDVVRNIKREVKNADLLMIWTDCDREGEHIGSEVVKICREEKARIEVKRARFSAIIASQIHRAFQHPGELDWHAAAAVESRIELDLRLGFAFTRMQCLNLQQRCPELKNHIISYGPCQFPTLGFVVERYVIARDFVPQDFWFIAVMDKRNEMEVNFNWKRNHLFDRQEVLTIYQRCRANPQATVTTVSSKQTRKFKPSPLTTVEMQKSGGRLLKLSPKTMLDTAEKLYQKGILSYPRTETDQYDKDFDFRSLIEKQTIDANWGPFATRLLDQQSGAFERPIDGSKNDKAHPPIHPTRYAGDLEGIDKKVYDYITRRFLASCNKHAVGRQTTVELDIANEVFTASGIVVVERNFLEVYPFDKWGGPALPEYRQGERFLPTKMQMKKGETSRPKLLTEADLVSLMDRNGIGTDATIAEHIATVIQRQYVKLLKEDQINYLIPSELGMGLVEGYNAIEFDGDKSLCKPLLRKEMEDRLTLICQGAKTAQEYIQESVQEYRAVYDKTMDNINQLVEKVAFYLRQDYLGAEEAEARRASPSQQGDDIAEEELGTPDPALRRQQVNPVISRPTAPVSSEIDPDEEEEFQIEGPRSRAANGSTRGRSTAARGSTGQRGTSSSRRNGVNGSSISHQTGRNTSSDACFRCGETGHWGKDCQNRGTGSTFASKTEGNGNGQVCYSCGDLGHWADVCPDKNASRATKRPRGGGTARGGSSSSTRGARGSSTRGVTRARGRGGP